MPQGMQVNGKAPTSPIGHPDVLWGLPGQGGLLTEWSETVPDLTWPESVRTFGRMRRDARLASILAAYFYPILRTNWAVDPEGVDRAEAVDLVATDLGLPILGEKGRPADAAIPGFRWHDHARLALLNLVYGHMVFERWYEVKNGRTHLAGVQERQPHTISMIDINDDGTIREVNQNTQDTPIPANRLLWYAHQREGANWAGVSMLRSCYTPWVLKHETMRVHATSIRRFGMGVPSVIAPPGATPGQVQQAQQLASQMRAGDTAGAGLPDGFTFQLTGLSGSVPDAVGFLNYLDQQMTTSALAQIVELGHGTYGTRALGESFLDLFLLSLQAVADMVADTATIGDPGMPGLAKSLVEYNWGEGEPVPRIVATDVGDRHEVTAVAISAMITSGALSPDPNLEAFLREAWGLPERSQNFPPPAAEQPWVPKGKDVPPGPGPAGGGGSEPAQPSPASQTGNVPPGPPSGTGAPSPAAQPAAARTEPVRPRRSWRHPFRGGGQAAARNSTPDGLRRPLSDVEAAAGMEPLVILSESKNAVSGLMAQWEPVGRAMRQDLTEQVAAAVDDGKLDKLTALHPDTTDAAALLTTAMQDMAWAGAQRLVKEAATQGVTISLAKIVIDDARIGRVARARAALIGNRLATEAARASLRVVAATAGTDAANSVSVHLDGLSPSPLQDELDAAMSAAQNMGRIEATTAGISDGYVATCWATEILDRRTCQPCEDIDGYQYPSPDEANADYANGGYIECAGHERCRGTIVVTWDQGDNTPAADTGPITDISGWDQSVLNALDSLTGEGESKAAGDRALAAIADAQGLNGIPATGDLNSAVADGGTRVWRGVKGMPYAEPDVASAQQAQHVDQFLTGTADRRIGTGLWGNGDYFTVTAQTALDYADGNPAGVIEAVLKAGANIVKDTDIEAEWQAYAAANPGHVVFNDVGRYAAMKGYDGMWAGKTLILFNRAALVVAP